MVATFNAFIADEDGATTVNWVVMTAACMSLALGTIALISTSVQENGAAASTMMEAYEINHAFDTETDVAAVNTSEPPTPVSDPVPIN